MPFSAGDFPVPSVFRGGMAIRHDINVRLYVQQFPHIIAGFTVLGIGRLLPRKNLAVFR